MTKKLLTALSASAVLVATPVLAQTDLAQRAAAKIGDAEQLGEDNDEAVFIGILAGALVVAGIVVALSSDKEELPVSP